MRYCISNYYISLLQLGYSREYLYLCAKWFFSDKAINNLNQITEYLNIFTCEEQRYDFLVLMDIDSIEYMDSINGKLSISDNIEEIDISSIKEDSSTSDLLREYEQLSNGASKHSKITIVSYYNDDYDPFSAIERFINHISFIQSFTKYFKHYLSYKQVYRILQKKGEGYREIKLPRKLKQRPYVEQSIIDQRIHNIITAKSMSYSAFVSIARAIEMHSEAIESRNTTSILKTFWTALETLFSSPDVTSMRFNVIHSLIPIIQKTYILKHLRAIYAQVSTAINIEDREALGIDTWERFVEYYASYAEDSPEMKKVYALLTRNPLLRSRLYSFRRQLRNGKSIYALLLLHQNRIQWQLERIYRIRNITTHLGEETSGVECVANHIHNYFDYVINYMLCKSENGDYIINTSAVVFEAIKDNEVYLEILKKNDSLSHSNYTTLLFGPDCSLCNYQFEH